MPRIIVVGGGLIGMAAGMMLAKQGCEVTVLERDREALPGSPGAAWRDWDRRYRQTVQLDRARKAQIDASMAGTPPALPPGMDGGGTPGWMEMQVAMLYDAEVCLGGGIIS